MTIFMLALFSAFVRWAQHSCSRALRLFLSGVNCDCAEYLSVRGLSVSCNRIIHGGADNGYSRGGFSISNRVKTTSAYGLQMQRRVFQGNGPLVHDTDFASARARRQGTSVPGLFSKAPNQKLEKVTI